MAGADVRVRATLRPMSGIQLRTATDGDAAAVAALIRRSTNAWYAARGLPEIFGGPEDATLVFWETYEALDPGCCIVACDASSGDVVGSCFYHPRPTHFSLGIMNVDPECFGRSIASLLLDRICALADEAELPLRLVSSALNLDSYSLYTRRAFVPRAIYQDMVLEDVDAAFARIAATPLREAIAAGIGRVREARADDIDAIVELGLEVEGLDRRVDFDHFVRNELGCWRCVVLEGEHGRLQGCLASIAHPGSTMLGPGFSLDEGGAAALILHELRARRGFTPVFLVPAHCESLVATMYSLGARNVELHVHQCRGAWISPNGVSLTSFLPESA